MVSTNNIINRDDEDYIKTVKLICIKNGWEYEKVTLNVHEETVDVWFTKDDKHLTVQFDFAELDIPSVFMSIRVTKLAEECRAFWRLANE
jgi:hypothetical protein